MLLTHEPKPQALNPKPQTLNPEQEFEGGTRLSPSHVVFPLHTGHGEDDPGALALGLEAL